MSQSLVNQITIDCLLNKELMGKHVMKQREKQINKDELQFYRKRISNLSEELLNHKIPEDLPPDVKYAYDTFIKASIDYFKIADNNDLLQEEYKDVELPPLHECSSIDENTSLNNDINNEANKLLMRCVKMDVPTLDKYVKQTTVKKTNRVILPKSREVNIMVPELNNINYLYEDINPQQNDEEQNKDT
jgi:hypothetical protein